MKKILFVDDEPNLLEALQRMLRPQRKEWEMLFALGGAAALEVLDKTPVDVVVTDMRMPGLDGAELLQLVHDRFPNVLRIVLSGHFEVEAGLRAVPVAHQFLTKPCEPDKLKAAIERSSQNSSSLTDESTRRIVGAIGTLPSPPRTCTQLMEAIQDPNVSMATVGRIINQDVAISAKVLQLVNSGFFGLAREVSNVSTALNLLGMDVLKQLVLSAGVLKTFQPRRKIQGFSLDQFEAHSQLTAKIANQISSDLGTDSGGVLAALLHDTGKLVLASWRPDELERAIAESAQQKRPLHECEWELFGTGHAEIGGYLLSLWGLPSSTVDAISFHHRPSMPGNQTGKGQLRLLIHVANALAHEGPDNPADLAAIPACCDPAYFARTGADKRISEWRGKVRGAKVY
ncbi:MAG TPA: response regulator [Bryobacteraceae bacterium]|jgi:HD-like signal output (HDOD) protein